MGIEDFKFTTTEFLPEEFFNGQLEGWAVFEYRSGEGRLARCDGG